MYDFDVTDTLLDCVVAHADRDDLIMKVLLDQ